MKTGTEALSARLLSGELPESVILPHGEAWPQTRSDVAKHPEIELLGTRRGAPIERRIEAIVAEARSRDVPDVTILFIAEALNAAKYPDYIVTKLASVSDSLDIVFFARHPVAGLPSIVAHRVQSWTSPKHLDVDFAAIMREAPKRFHYDKFMDRWSGEGHRLIPIPYFEDDRKSDGLMVRFTKHTGIVVPQSAATADKNASLGKDQLLRLAELKRERASRREMPILRVIAEKTFYAHRTRIQREEPGKRWTLSAAERRQIVEFYRESTARFKKQLGSTARTTDWKRWFAEIEQPRSR